MVFTKNHCKNVMQNTGELIGREFNFLIIKSKITRHFEMKLRRRRELIFCALVNVAQYIFYVVKEDVTGVGSRFFKSSKSPRQLLI
jgi:hypothetical protein